MLTFGIIISSNAQFFKPERRPTASQLRTLTATTAITQNVIRPVANIASYATPGNIGLTGAGVSYQHQEWSDPDQRWKVIYSINALTWYGTDNSVYYGIAGGALNNLLLIGVATHDGKHFLGTVGIGINMN